MKILSLLLLLSFSNLSASNWLTSMEDAQKLALATDKLIIVDFWASWCGPCKKMDMESWNTPEVQELLQNFVPLRLDIDKYKDISRQYGVKAIPYVFIVDANGEVLFDELGLMDKTEVLKVLKEFSVNTSFLRNESVAFYQHQNYVTSLRLAQKYLDYSLYLEDKIKDEFLKLADNYLRMGGRMMEKDQSNYQLMNQKIELLELNADLYREKYGKVERQLNKLNPDQIEESNKALYTYLHYILAAKSGDEAQSKKWQNALVLEDQSKIFQTKSEIFLKD